VVIEKFYEVFGVYMYQCITDQLVALIQLGDGDWPTRLRSRCPDVVPTISSLKLTPQATLHTAAMRSKIKPAYCVQVDDVAS